MVLFALGGYGRGEGVAEDRIGTEQGDQVDCCSAVSLTGYLSPLSCEPLYMTLLSFLTALCLELEIAPP